MIVLAIGLSLSWGIGIGFGFGAWVVWSSVKDDLRFLDYLKRKRLIKIE